MAENLGHCPFLDESNCRKWSADQIPEANGTRSKLKAASKLRCLIPGLGSKCRRPFGWRRSLLPVTCDAGLEGCLLRGSGKARADLHSARNPIHICWERGDVGVRNSRLSPCTSSPYRTVPQVPGGSVRILTAFAISLFGTSASR